MLGRRHVDSLGHLALQHERHRLADRLAQCGAPLAAAREDRLVRPLLIGAAKEEDRIVAVLEQEDVGGARGPVEHRATARAHRSVPLHVGQQRQVLRRRRRAKVPDELARPRLARRRRRVRALAAGLLLKWAVHGEHEGLIRCHVRQPGELRRNLRAAHKRLGGQRLPLHGREIDWHAAEAGYARLRALVQVHVNGADHENAVGIQAMRLGIRRGKSFRGHDEA